MFIAPSLFVKEQLIKNGFDAQKIIVIPHFIDLERYQTQPKPIGYPYVLFFGRLDESKGADVLINAFAQIKTDHKLVIIGSGPEEINLKNQVKKLNLTDKVVFIGRKEKNELLNFIQNADFAVFPSRVHETFGLGALETFACGKPVIASRAGSFNNLIQPQQTGLLFTSDNHQELAEQIQYLLDNPNETTRMGKNAYAFSLDYSANKHYEKISAIYEALIDYEKKKK